MPDVVKTSTDDEKTPINVEKSMSDAEKTWTDDEKTRIDVETSSTAVEKTTIDDKKTPIGVEKSMSEVETTSTDDKKTRIAVETSSTAVEKTTTDDEKTPIDVEKSMSDFGKTRLVSWLVGILILVSQCTSDSNSQYRCQCGNTYYNNNGACANRTFSRGACLQLCICSCSQLCTSAPPGKPGLVRFVTVVGLLSG